MLNFNSEGVFSSEYVPSLFLTSKEYVSYLVSDDLVWQKFTCVVYLKKMKISHWEGIYRHETRH